jgi:hypothetical protein
LPHHAEAWAEAMTATIAMIFFMMVISKFFGEHVLVDESCCRLWSAADAAFSASMGEKYISKY